MRLRPDLEPMSLHFDGRSAAVVGFHGALNVTHDGTLAVQLLEGESLTITQRGHPMWI